MSAGAPDPLVLPVQVPEGAATLALLERIAAAVEDTGKKSEEASEKTASGFQRAQEGIRSAADTFNEVRGAVSSLIGDINSLVESLAEGADEADALRTRSQQLGVDFDEAAESAGRFLDETSAMGAANELAARGVRLTQEQLNALTRVAGATSQQLRITTEEGVERLTAALISGRSRALAPFGSELTAASGHTHTMQERLHALVEQAGKVTPAVDDARDSVKRFNDSIDDLKRDFSSGFVDGITKMHRIGEEARGAAGDVGDLNVSVRELGGFVGETLSRAANGFRAVLAFLATGVHTVLASVGALAEAMGQISVGNIRGAGRAAAAYMNDAADNGYLGDSFRELQRAVAAVNAQGGASDAGDGTSRDSARRADMVFTPEELATPPDGGGGDGGGGGGGGGRRTNDHPDGITIGAAASAILDRLIAEARTRQTEQRAADAARVQGEAPGRANAAQERDRREAQVRAEGDALVAREREEQDRVKTREREQDDQAKRLENLQRFTEQWRQLHSEQVNVAASAAQSLNATFESLGSAMGAHFYALVDGQETLGQALQGILSDTLDALAKEAYAKGGFYFAEGLARLVMYDFPGAATSFGASVAYFAAGAGAQTLGAAVAAPAQPSAGGGSAGAGRGAESFGRPANDTASISGPTIVQHFYAPILGGRDALDSEVGQRMGRYTDAASQRQVRDRGGAPRRAA